MAITVSTDAPQKLLSAIKSAIDDDEVRTWSYDTDGDFTHTAPQWKNEAWLRPRIQEASLTLNILAPSGSTLSSEVYAIYHGRFIEMLLAHFDERFKQAAASSFPIKPDRIGG